MSIYVAIVIGDAKHSCRMQLFGNLDKKQQDDGPKPFRYKYSDVWEAISQDLKKEYLHMPEKHAEALQKLLEEADIVRKTKSKSLLVPSLASILLNLKTRSLPSSRSQKPKKSSFSNSSAQKKRRKSWNSKNSKHLGLSTTISSSRLQKTRY